MRPTDAQDLYHRLGVNRDVTPDQVRKAYKAMALRWHPDRNPENARAHLEFIAVSEAYEVLSDSQKRTAYDRTSVVHSHRRQQTAARQTTAEAEARSYRFYEDIFINDFKDLKYNVQENIIKKIINNEIKPSLEKEIINILDIKKL